MRTRVGSWDILVEQQLMDQRFSQAYRCSHSIEGKVQALVELKTSHFARTAGRALR